MSDNVRSLEDIQEITGIPTDYLSDTPVYVNKEVHDSLLTSYSQIFKLMQELFLKKNKILTNEEITFCEKFVIDDQSEMDTQTHLVGRPDGVVKNNKISYFELNLTPSVGGIGAFSTIQSFFSNQENKKLETPIDAFRNYVTDLGKTAVYRKNGIEPRIDEEDKSVVEMARTLGAEVEYIELDDLLNHVNEYDSILRFHSYADADDTTMKKIEELESKAFQNRKKSPLAIKQSSYLYSKVFMAFFSEYLDKEDYVVWSRWLGDSSNTENSKYSDLFSLALENKDQYVVKKDFSNRGRHVYFGDELDTESWSKILTQCREEGDWILQENALGERSPFQINGKKNNLMYIISPYFFGRHYGGTCVRVVLDEKSKTCVMPGTTQTAVSTLLRGEK